MKVNKENEEFIEIEVHWYAKDTHPFNGVYKDKDGSQEKINKKRKIKVKI
jgi:hypothetical protein